MLTHLLQVASFKSKPQHFSAPGWLVLVLGVLLLLVQAYALNRSLGGELHRMVVASGIKLLVLGALLYGWMRSVDAEGVFASSLLVILAVSLVSEVGKLPLSIMIRETKKTADVGSAVLFSMPYWALIAWQYSVWFYVLREASQRAKVEVLTVIITLVLVSEVAGSVLSKIGSPIEGFN